MWDWHKIRHGSARKNWESLHFWLIDFTPMAQDNSMGKSTQHGTYISSCKKMDWDPPTSHHIVKLTHTEMVKSKNIKLAADAEECFWDWAVGRFCFCFVLFCFVLFCFVFKGRLKGNLLIQKAHGDMCFPVPKLPTKMWSQDSPLVLTYKCPGFVI